MIQKLFVKDRMSNGMYFLSKNEKSSQNREVLNDSTNVYIRGFSIDYNEILLILKEFVDAKINSKIEMTTITVEDANSHVGIPNVDL